MSESPSLLPAREFFSLRQIAETARRENWPTGKALQESRKLLARKRRSRRAS